jgi:hypothetical protein
MIGFKANQIRHVPGAALPPALRWLILTDNQISQLPTEIGRCTQLQKLMLAGNRLTALPEEMAACTQLELLRIAANCISEIPPWLLAMPRLSWLAYAGNPCCAQLEGAALAAVPLPRIAWQALQLADKLGEGASGVIHQANWQRQDRPQAVAVKLFKGAMTSDGLPHSEMAACISAGSHPNLIAVHGRIEYHPKREEGLVMALVASTRPNSASAIKKRSDWHMALLPPPSTCTRKALCMATCTAITFCTAVRGMLCWVILAPHLSLPRMTGRPQKPCNALKCAPLPACLVNCLIVALAAAGGQQRQFLSAICMPVAPKKIMRTARSSPRSCKRCKTCCRRKKSCWPLRKVRLKFCLFEVPA